jgi:hypothetical protein
MFFIVVRFMKILLSVLNQRMHNHTLLSNREGTFCRLAVIAKIKDYY